MIARLWNFWPILELEKDKTYRLHLTSMDYNHGFSLQPVNINIQIVPGYEHVVKITPNQSGTYSVVCNEFCGIGHHKMMRNLEDMMRSGNRDMAQQMLAELQDLMERLQSGRMKLHVPYDRLVSAELTRNPLSSPALSLQRIRVRYQKPNGKETWVQISPPDRG